MHLTLTTLIKRKIITCKNRRVSYIYIYIYIYGVGKVNSSYPLKMSLDQNARDNCEISSVQYAQQGQMGRV